MGLSSLALASVLAAVTFFAAPGSPPVVVDTLSGVADVGTGTGWGLHPDSTPGAGVDFVEGPATPPLGGGSLMLSTPASTDRALVYAVPTGVPGQAVPTPVAWSDFTASYSTFIPDGAAISNTPTLRFVGYQDLTPIPSGFTTLSIQPSYLGTVQGGVWQTWNIGPESVVFQSNASDAGFCVEPNTCTLSDFAAQYSQGGWALIQIGLGSGLPAGSVGYADAVVVRQGTTAEYAYDFEAPVPAASTATIAAGAATSTGGSATVTLVASPDAATPTVPFTITATLPDGTVQTQQVEVDTGTTLEVSVPVPFGVTHIQVSADGSVITEGDVTFTAPVPPVTPPGTGGGVLPPTGFDPIAALWGSALLAAGLTLVAVGRMRGRGTRVKGEGNLIG